MPPTARQLKALHLYYVEGWSHRRIAGALGIKHAPVQRLIMRGSRWIVEKAADEGGASLPLMRALIAPGPTSSTTNVGLAASRVDDLLDALELRMEQRAYELAATEECMSAGSFQPTRIKRNHYDQWELRYLARHKGEPLPTSAYNPVSAARHCSGAPTCTCTCDGCRWR